MRKLGCEVCGAPLELNDYSSVIECQYCGMRYGPDAGEGSVAGNAALLEFAGEMLEAGGSYIREAEKTYKFVIRRDASSAQAWEGLAASKLAQMRTARTVCGCSLRDFGATHTYCVGLYASPVHNALDPRTRVFAKPGMLDEFSSGSECSDVLYALNKARSLCRTEGEREMLEARFRRETSPEAVESKSSELKRLYESFDARMSAGNRNVASMRNRIASMNSSLSFRKRFRVPLAKFFFFFTPLYLMFILEPRYAQNGAAFIRLGGVIIAAYLAGFAVRIRNALTWRSLEHRISSAVAEYEAACASLPSAGMVFEQIIAEGTF